MIHRLPCKIAELFWLEKLVVPPNVARSFGGGPPARCEQEPHGTTDMRRAMNKTMNIMIATAGFLLLGASVARAQAPAPPSQGEIFLNVSAGGGGQNRTFTSTTTFDSFGE